MALKRRARPNSARDPVVSWRSLRSFRPKPRRGLAWSRIPTAPEGAEVRRLAMSKVVLDVSMSLDGFTAGPNVREAEPMGDGGERATLIAVTRNRPLLT